ncbi:hypothetical protein PGB28_05015 [Primorskyibacter aestuariivivens]|uniref:hypothetical protein n=1 Tax=Primorskyibacter aestuariivivens TaxID=1888912 RepID=UPI002300977F|nr:hypothetical protein [Primorskyibacter aestuariivivens]MDA7427811.1 hypothetical protein [Primorskyibacter aestuariivivens]
MIALVHQEREKALSPREWKHRLAGHGYALRDTDHGTVITSLSQGCEICPLPRHLAS